MKANILIVDDEEAIRHSLGEILRLEGYSVATAESGEAAVDAIQKAQGQQPYDLVLLDIRMPGMDGIEVLKFINRFAPETRVVLLTAHGSLESAIEALRVGAHDYILKPASTRTILSSVEKGLARRAEFQRKRLLLDQLETSVQRLKDVEGYETPNVTEHQTINLDDGIVLDLSRREIWHNNEKIGLTPTEGRLIKVLVENRGRVLSHKELVFLVQGYETSEWEAPEVLRPLISRLRRKLSAFPGGEKWIANVRGTGYVFEWEGQTEED
jgi:DNA-binding response OmpR family regulator